MSFESWRYVHSIMLHKKNKNFPSQFSCSFRFFLAHCISLKVCTHYMSVSSYKSLPAYESISLKRIETFNDCLLFVTKFLLYIFHCMNSTHYHYPFIDECLNFFNLYFIFWSLLASVYLQRGSFWHLAESPIYFILSLCPYCPFEEVILTYAVFLQNQKS